ALSSGPYRVPVGSTAAVFYAMLAAPDLAGLQAAADRAVIWFADSVTTDVHTAPGARLPAVALGEPVPNPFNPSTRIDLEVRVASDVLVRVFDAQGRYIATLASGRRQPHVYPLTWLARTQTGHPVASGIYFVRLEANGIVQTRRVALV